MPSDSPRRRDASGPIAQQARPEERPRPPRTPGDVLCAELSRHQFALAFERIAVDKLGLRKVAQLQNEELLRSTLTSSGNDWINKPHERELPMSSTRSTSIGWTAWFSLSVSMSVTRTDCDARQKLDEGDVAGKMLELIREVLRLQFLALLLLSS